MDFSRLVKWIVILAIAVVAYKIVWPKLHGGGSASSSSSGSSGGGAHEACVAAAESASNAWGSGVGSFANPPYDTAAWSSFENDIYSKISAAESQCTCSDKSCTTVRSAMTDLRGLISEMGTSIRGGSPPPGNLVQRQESIDNRLTEARASAQEGK